MSTERFAFGPFVLNLGNNTLSRQGLPVPVGLRGIRLLGEFVKNTGEVMTKSALLEAAWPGIFVEEANLSVQISSLRKLLGPADSGREWIATVPRIGYRFTATVAPIDDFGNPVGDRAEPGPSIAVLPFTNLSADPEQQYFADGLSEDIIANLARLRWLFVASRNSSFAYRDAAVDPRRVGSELGVRYVLGGSVRRSGQRLRIVAELSDASTGLQTWANRYNADSSDFFAVQDEISESVIGAIEPRLYAAEHERLHRRSPESLDAWGLVMKAMPQVWAWYSTREIDAAESILNRAVEIDPDYARAHSLLAWTHAARVQAGETDVPVALAKAQEMARQALQKDPADPWTHFSLGYVHMIGRNFDAAVKALTEAIEMNPSLAFAHSILGCAYGYGGMPEDGLHHCLIAERMSPRDFSEPGNLGSRGICHFVAGRYDAAMECEQKAVDLRTNFCPAWTTLAASAGLIGKIDVASAALLVARQLNPSLSTEWIERYHALVRRKDRTTYIEGLRAAGLD